MKTENYREQYHPPCIELIPGADPYIADLVAGASWASTQQARSRRELTAEAAHPSMGYPGSELKRGTFRARPVSSQKAAKVRAGWQ